MNTQQVADFNCFVYAQVSKQQYFSFQPIVRSYCINELFLSFIRALALLQLREQLMRLSLPPLLEAPRRLPPLQELHLTFQLALDLYVNTSCFHERSLIAFSFLLSSLFQCHDSNDQRYSYILGLLGNVSATRCSQFCAQYTSPSLVGFSRDIRPQNYYRCYCLYSGGAIPAPPSGSDWAAIQNENKGTGPISSVSNDPSYECYAFPQVRQSTSYLPFNPSSFHASHYFLLY